MSDEENTTNSDSTTDADTGNQNATQDASSETSGASNTTSSTITGADSTQATTSTPVMVKIAILDADGIFQGVTEKDQSAVTSSDVLLPNGCDLPAGFYKWNAAQNRFDAVPSLIQTGPNVFTPSAESAFYYLVEQLKASGVTLPAQTEAWRAAFAQNISVQ